MEVQEKGEAARAIAERRRREEARLSELQASVRQRLSLRRLLKDPALPLGFFDSACERLMALPPSTAALFESLSIQVSYVNQVAPDGSHIDISWDFDL